MGRLILAAMIGLAAAPAAAQDCGSSDDSGSSDSCPIDWSYDDSSGDAASSTREVCRETSDVVGYQRCRRFGYGWNARGVPAFRLSIGGSARRLRVGHLSFRGEAEHFNEGYVIGDAGRDLHDADLLAGGFAARLDVTIFDYVSVGAELFFARSAVGGDPRVEGGVTHTPEAVSAAGGGLVVGAAIPIGPFTLRPEALLGGRAVILESETRVGDCVETALSTVGEWVIEPRLALEWFASPYFGVSVFVGANVLSLGEVNAGLQLSLHTRSYDAASSR